MDYDEVKLAVKRGIQDVLDAGLYSYFEVPRITISPRLFKDGNMWCALLGNNVQDGIVGFGESPYKALMAFKEEMIKPISIPCDNRYDDVPF